MAKRWWQVTSSYDSLRRDAIGSQWQRELSESTFRLNAYGDGIVEPFQ